MKADIIKFEPFAFVQLLKCNIFHEVNAHSSAEINGIIDSKDELSYVSMAAENKQVNIYAIAENNSDNLIFTGVINSLSIYNQNDIKYLTVKIVSNTKLMDMVEENRTFQESTLLYKHLLTSIGTYDGYDYIMTEGKEKPIDKLIVQYKETDWQFAKRLSSHFNSYILSDYYGSSPRYFFGMPNLQQKSNVNAIAYTLNKDTSEYIYNLDHGVSGINEADYTYFIVKEREIRRLGEPVAFMGQQLYVYSIKSYLEGSVLVNEYTLKTKAGFKKVSKTNKGITGASLSGSITNVQYDVVQMNAFIDKDVSVSGNRWFPYSTVYSSPDGTGWYAMPEINDEVRMYFPTDQEKDAYVISSTHLQPGAGTQAGSSGARSDPDYKSIKNKYGKEVLFAPTFLTMRSAGMSITLDDENGISIISDKKILFHSDESISAITTSSDISLVADNSIVMQQGSAQIVIETDDISISSNIVDIQ